MVREYLLIYNFFSKIRKQILSLPEFVELVGKYQHGIQQDFVTI